MAHMEPNLVEDQFCAFQIPDAVLNSGLNEPECQLLFDTVVTSIGIDDNPTRWWYYTEELLHSGIESWCGDDLPYEHYTAMFDKVQNVLAHRKTELYEMVASICGQFPDGYFNIHSVDSKAGVLIVVYMKFN